MKEEILKIAKDLQKGVINTQTARTLLLGLFGVSKSVCGCSENDRVEEDGELYCIKCGSKWD